MSTTYITPLTELEAVNEMLASIQESPITSIADAAEQSPDASTALARLRAEARSIQTRGWSFNTDIEFPLTPDAVSGEIALPYGTLSIDISDRTYADRGRYVIRGTRLYDRVKHTYVFPDKLYANIIILLPFEEMPEAFRDLATKKAVRAFQQQMRGEGGDLRFTSEDIEHAWATAAGSDTDQSDSNMLDTPDPATNRLVNRITSGR